jgi:hypothetical protein
VGTASCGGSQLEGTAVTFGAAAHAGQPAGAGGRTEAAAVVGDVKGDQPVLEHQGDGDGGRVGVACAVGQGFPGDGENVMSQLLVRTGVERAGEADAGGEAELRGVLIDDLHDPGGQARRGRAGMLEPEDAGADLLDDLVQGVNVAVDQLRGGRVAVGGVALHPHTEGEQILDHVVVQVTRDPVAVFGLSHGELVGAGPGEFHRHRGVVGEGGGHVQVCLGESRTYRQPAQQQRAPDLLAGRQRHDDQRAGNGSQHSGGRLAVRAGYQAGLAGADRLPDQ